MNVLRFADLVAAGRVAGRRVFIRADLNVPQDDAGRITEDTRIRASLPCIELALRAGAAVMVTSHLGRPTEGEPRPEDSLAPVAARLGELLGRAVPLRKRWLETGVAVGAGDVVLLENCRLHKGEKKNDPALAKKMAALCDVYVNDAFGTAHRAEASTYGIAEFAPVACAGPLLAAEIDAITRALAAPKRPLVAIVAGAKVSTKLAILQSLATEGRPPDRRRRHRQHLPPRRGLGHRQEPRRAGARRRGARRDRGDARARRRGAAAGRRRHRARVQGRRRGDDEAGRRGRRRRADPRHRAEERRRAGVAPAIGGDDRLERPGRRLRVRRLRARHRDRRPRDRRARRRTAWPAAATRWPRSPSTASPTRSTTSPPAAAPSSRCSKARRCRRSRSSSGAPAKISRADA